MNRNTIDEIFEKKKHENDIRNEHQQELTYQAKDAQDIPAAEKLAESGTKSVLKSVLNLILSKCFVCQQKRNCFPGISHRALRDGVGGSSCPLALVPCPYACACISPLALCLYLPKPIGLVIVLAMWCLVCI